MLKLIKKKKLNQKHILYFFHLSMNYNISEYNKKMFCKIDNWYIIYGIEHKCDLVKWLN